MRHVKSRDLEVEHLEGYLLEYGDMILLYALRYGMLAQYAVEHTVRAEEFQMAVVAEKGVDVFHMVGMIMRQKDALHVLHLHSIGGQPALKIFRTYAYIHDQAPFGGSDITAVAA